MVKRPFGKLIVGLFIAVSIAVAFAIYSTMSSSSGPSDRVVQGLIAQHQTEREKAWDNEIRLFRKARGITSHYNPLAIAISDAKVQQSIAQSDGSYVVNVTYTATPNDHDLWKSSRQLAQIKVLSADGQWLLEDFKFLDDGDLLETQKAIVKFTLTGR